MLLSRTPKTTFQSIRNLVTSTKCSRFASKKTTPRMSKHEPFEVVEGRRPPFEADKFAYSKQPNSEWVPGQGLNGRTDLPGYHAFAEGATLEGSQKNFKHIDPEQVENKGELYKLMIGGIVPRPIAFCSTISEDGIYNLAPFSYFQACGHSPPLITLTCSASKPIVDGEGKHKDTLNNIRATKEFVVNIISEPFAEASNFTAVNAPPEINEWDLAGLTPIPSETIKPPRVGESAFSMECTVHAIHDIFSDDEQTRLTASLVVGRVRRFHVREDLFGPTGAIDPARLLPIGRLGGITYGRVTDSFEAPRYVWDDVKDSEHVKKIQEEVVKTGGRTAALNTASSSTNGRL